MYGAAAIVGQRARIVTVASCATIILAIITSVPVPTWPRVEMLDNAELVDDDEPVATLNRLHAAVQPASHLSAGASLAKAPWYSYNIEESIAIIISNRNCTFFRP